MATLSKLLNAKEPLFDKAIADLEKITGQKSLDVLLLSEIEQKIHNRMRRLSLDPVDTTGQELYRALDNRVAADNKRVAKLIGAEEDIDNVRRMTPLIVAAAKAAKAPKDCWVLKRSVAKKFLKNMPPQQMMKHLGYRTVDSLLKREPFDEMYTALRFSEGADWLNKYNELFRQVTPGDFESRSINIIAMDHDKWVGLAAGYVHKKLHNVTHTKELGTIAVLPTAQAEMRGITLKTLPLIFHYINEIRLYSAYFRLKSRYKNFGSEIVDTMIAEPSKMAVLAGQHIHWRVIQRYYGRLKDEFHPEAFEPHVHPEDLHWRKAEDILFELDSEMEFWRDLDYVGISYPSGPLSFNLLDVSFAYSNREPFANRYTYHFRESLWNEVFMRYMGEPILEQQVLRQLDNDLVAPEKLVGRGVRAL